MWQSTRAMAGAIIIAAIALAGCEHFEPTLPYAVPDEFEANSNTEPAKVSEWWKRFGSGELNEYMGAVSDGNLDVAVAVARLEQSEAQSDVALAALFPVLTYTDNSVRSRASGTTVPGKISPATYRTSYTKQINASYVVDVWGLNRDLLKAALRNRDASNYQVEVVRLTAQAAVANNFLTFAANYERVAIAKQNLVNAQRVLRVIKERLAAGTASALDVAQQENLAATQRAAIPALRLTAETSRTALALVLGRPPQGFHPETRTARRLRIPKVSPGLPSTLIVRRPDVRVAEEQMLANDANVDAARKAFLPNITLTGFLGYQSASLATLLRPESLIWNIASNITQPIFDGGKLRAQLRLSEAQRQELLETYRKAILQALTDVENALIALRENAAREAAQQVAVSTAQTAFTLSEQRLAEGTIDLTTLITAQNSLFQAQDSLIQIRLARLQAAVSLFQALGGDWDDEDPKAEPGFAKVQAKH